MTTIPPCTGLHDLFDSNQPADHLEARAICRTCPIRLACHDRLQQALRDTPHGGKDYGPQGTWAGRLVGGEPRVRATAKSVEEEREMFTTAELKEGHRLYGRGARDDLTVRLERIYQRTRKQRAKEAA